MALISLLLHVQKNMSLELFSGGFAKSEHPVYVQPIGTGLQCDNPNCITGDPSERQYAANKFYLIEDDSAVQCRLRCLYCEKDVEEETAGHAMVADTTRKTFSPKLTAAARAQPDRLTSSSIAAKPTPRPRDLRRANRARKLAPVRPACVRHSEVRA
jgi:Aspartate carbamoyltransferase regulatory chain, metal binding domain